MKWVGAVTKKWIVSVTGVFVIAVASVILMTPHAAHADPHDVTGNTPSGLTWLNRFYIVDDKGNNYYDSDTYDGNYTYEEQGDFPQTSSTCANQIVFTYKLLNQPGSLADDISNMYFFYAHATDGGVPADYSMKVRLCTWIDSAGGQRQKVYQDDSAVSINSNNGARRIVFYKNDNNQIVNIPSGVTFSQKGTFAGIPRYFRDDELSDSNNSCPDVILVHTAQPTGSARQFMGVGGSSDVPDSSMLYAVTKDNSLNGISESYQYVTAPNNITETTCHIKADDVNQTKGGTYQIGYWRDNHYDGYFQSSGPDKNGNPIKGGGKYGDDTFIIFIGTTANMPKNPDGTINGNPTGNGGSGSSDKTDVASCKGGNLGWVLCPIIEGIQSAVGLLQQTMQAFLIVNPLPVNSGPIYDSWNNIRNIANIVFVIAFFAIIFSQATSIGISNYGIKRLLPRLVLIAIFTNLSYFVCSFLVDIFNIMGVGIIDLFAIVNNGSAGTVTVSDATSAVSAAAIIAVITWAIASGAIVEVFPMILTAFLAFLIMIAILILRQAIIIFLVILSPLAFVAGLLPGTQSWLKRWYDMFTILLVMYPLIMGLFAAANIASSILTATAGG